MNNQTTNNNYQSRSKVLLLLVLFFVAMNYKDLKNGFIEGYGAIKHAEKANMHNALNKQVQAAEFNLFLMLTKIY